jgi:hypothetical protein
VRVTRGCRYSLYLLPLRSRRTAEVCDQAGIHRVGRCELLFIGEFGLVDMRAAQYSAFLQNLLMSGLFIAMFVARRGARGQSLTIGFAKWIGTLAPTLVFGVIQDSPFILGIGILCSVFDLAYIALLLWAGTNPPQLVASAGAL